MLGWIICKKVIPAEEAEKGFQRGELAFAGSPRVPLPVQLGQVLLEQGIADLAHLIDALLFQKYN